MATVKITELTAYTNPASTDVVPIVDVGTDTTKKVTIADLLENAGDGTAGAAAFAFDGDADTGMYRTGVNALGFTTGGTGRLFIDASGNVGINNANPEERLDADGAIAWRGALNSGKTSAGALDRSGNDLRIRAYGATAGTGQLVFRTGGGGGSVDSEAARIDSSGRLLVGTTSTFGSKQALFQDNAEDALTIRVQSNSYPYGWINLDRQLGGSLAVTNGAALGSFNFRGWDGSNAITSASIQANVDGTPGTNDMPGRLTFSTTASGSTPTERMRIDSSGRLLVGTSSTRGVGDTTPAKILVDTTDYVVFSGIQNANTSFGAILSLGKSRGISAGSATIVQQDDVLGEIKFAGADGTDAISEGAQIRAEVDGTPGANDMPGRLVFSSTASGSSSPTEQLRITSDRYVRLASGTGGIQFGGDTAAANALDDYEEGTWTPSVEFGGATTGITYNARQGYYVKTGKVVHVWLYFNLSSKGSATGTATVAGLPFTSEDFNVAALTTWPGSKPSRRQNETSSDFAMAVLENNSEISISNGAGSAVTDSTFTNGTIIECALCYRAA